MATTAATKPTVAVEAWQKRWDDTLAAAKKEGTVTIYGELASEAKQGLTEAFKKSEDVHAITASGIFGVKPKDVTSEQRAVGKTVNFATIYGQTAYGLSRQLGIDVGEASEYIDNYFKKS